MQRDELVGQRRRDVASTRTTSRWALLMRVRVRMRMRMRHRVSFKTVSLAFKLESKSSRAEGWNRQNSDTRVLAGVRFLPTEEEHERFLQRPWQRSKHVHAHSQHRLSASFVQIASLRLAARKLELRQPCEAGRKTEEGGSDQKASIPMRQLRLISGNPGLCSCPRTESGFKRKIRSLSFHLMTERHWPV